MDEFKELVKAFFEPVLKMAVNNAKEVKNEDTDKRKLIDEVAGIMKSAGCDDEVIRTAIAKMEKIGYEKSEDGGADNEKPVEKTEEKKVEGLKKDLKDDVDNKCGKKVDNAKTDYYAKLNEIYNSSSQTQNKELITREDRLKDGLRF